ncbi:MAG TPA: 30S ribosomal protein S27e [archaeon]|nr:30S ribosomal protein S27e [archaeon]
MTTSITIPGPKTKFYKVKCQCGNEQIIFSAPSTKVLCLACSTPLGKSSSSKIKLSAKVLKEF